MIRIATDNGKVVTRTALEIGDIADEMIKNLVLKGMTNIEIIMAVNWARYLVESESVFEAFRNGIEIFEE